jgi:hypothetical protein
MPQEDKRNVVDKVRTGVAEKSSLGNTARNERKKSVSQMHGTARKTHNIDLALNTSHIPSLARVTCMHTTHIV